MGFLDNLASVAQKGLNNLEKLAEDAGREWKYSVKPEIDKHSKIAKEKITELSESAGEEWEKTVKPNLISAYDDSKVCWDNVCEIADSISKEIKGSLRKQWDKIWESKLGSDIDRYPVVQNLTKEDVEEAGKVFIQILGIGSVGYTAVMALTTWLPAAGIPVSGAVMVKSLTEIARVYPELSEEEQARVRRFCSFVRFFFTGIWIKDS